MVNFSVFNELSLPLNEHNAKDKFGCFFELLRELKKKGLNQIRMSNDFKDYYILENITFEQFFGQQKNRDFCTRLKSFIGKAVIKIDSPIIKPSDKEQIEIQNTTEYFFADQSIDGGLACCDIWDTIAVSFNSSDQWNVYNIVLRKQTISPNGALNEQNINIKHSSKVEHLNSHNDYFDALELEIRLSITQESFWEQKNIFFPDIIVFCPEVESQITRLDKLVFQQAMSILREVETQRKLITDFNHSRESQTVRDSQDLKEMRTFTLNNNKTFFENHIKSLPHGNRIYFLEQDEKIHIGYIGKHLST